MQNIKTSFWIRDIRNNIEKLLEKDVFNVGKIQYLQGIRDFLESLGDINDSLEQVRLEELKRYIEDTLEKLEEDIENINEFIFKKDEFDIWENEDDFLVEVSINERLYIKDTLMLQEGFTIIFKKWQMEIEEIFKSRILNNRIFDELIDFYTEHKLSTRTEFEIVKIEEWQDETEFEIEAWQDEWS